MIEVYTDGASRGDPGTSGAGIYIKQGKNKFEYAIPLGELSNHEAEFLAVIKALEICEERFPGEIISIRSDSKLVVDVVEKNFTRNQNFKPFLEQINQKSTAFSYLFIKWIPEKQNPHADRLAKRAINDMI
ncbi:ribonuclease HI family protein [Oceanobacillus manasiensis]|uniref:ribonuclease HI family protein n=1 Tax=Oceanobacillus manasiensis TaxID=586413 RepID=UPI0005A74221|nr:ribonuclease HI family protein [Oceanobacillus manasiensis]